MGNYNKIKVQDIQINTNQKERERAKKGKRLKKIMEIRMYYQCKKCLL